MTKNEKVLVGILRELRNGTMAQWDVATDIAIKYSRTCFMDLIERREFLDSVMRVDDPPKVEGK